MRARSMASTCRTTMAIAGSRGRGRGRGQQADQPAENADAAASADQPAPGGRGRGGPPTTSMAAGLNRTTWNLEYPGPTTFPGMVLWGATTSGPTAPPGNY